ncbi:MAG TPA: germination protein YpeB [Oscillospiraceae bacterium]|nr:germination protein YpeB [Oscillospiraceae bacterium]
MRRTVRIITFAAAALAVLLGFWRMEALRAEAAERELGYAYQRAFFSLCTAVSELDASLAKSSYATTGALAGSLCTELLENASAAQTALGELPFAANLENISAFLARTGDYAAALARLAAAGGYDASARENLTALAAQSTPLKDSLLDIQTRMDRGEVTLEALLSADDAMAENESTGLLRAEGEFPEFPTLIYDGPFSSHIARQTPKMLEGQGEVSEAEARSAAAAFLEADESALSLVNESEGTIPAYGFSADTRLGDLYVSVTRAGGFVSIFFTDYTPEAAALSPEACVEKATDFLAARGIPDMQASYYTISDATLTINFLSVQDDVLCYPDLIKIAVSMEDGTVLNFDASGYLACHTARDFSALAVSEEEARAVLDARLEVLSHKLCVIPTEGEYEVFCHEFKCRSDDGRHILVYVNAETGAEQKILLLLEDQSGTLVI